MGLQQFFGFFLVENQSKFISIRQNIFHCQAYFLHPKINVKTIKNLLNILITHKIIPYLSYSWISNKKNWRQSYQKIFKIAKTSHYHHYQFNPHVNFDEDIIDVEIALEGVVE